MEEQHAVFEAVDEKARQMAEKGHNTEQKLRDALWEAADYPQGEMEKACYIHIEKLINETMQQEMTENPEIAGSQTIDGVMVSVSGKTPITEKEARNYITYVRTQACHRGDAVKILNLRTVDGDKNVQIDYSIRTEPMERIRRITGYLGGTVDRWNNAKQAELHDRVKHGFSR